MDKERKQKKEEMSQAYNDFFYDTKNEISEFLLNSYVKKDLENEVFDLIYDSYKNNVPVKEALGKDNKKALEKMVKGKTKKTLLEAVMEAIYRFSLSGSIIVVLLYLFNFMSSKENGYNKGIEMYYNVYTLTFAMIMCVIVMGCLAYINKTKDKSKAARGMQIANYCFIGIFAVLAFLCFILEGSQFIHFNFCAVLGVFLFIFGVSFGITLYSSKKNYKKYIDKHQKKK